MARRRLIIHGSQEELDMFEPIYNTRLRLQHGASSSRFQLPDPPPSAESENEDDDEGTASNVQSVDREGNGAAVETCIWRRSGDEENHDSLTDEPHSTTLTEERVGSANNGSTGLEGDGSEIPASASPEAPDLDTDTDNSDSDESDSDS